MKLLDSTEGSWISTHYREASKIHDFGCCRPRLSDNKMHLQSKSGQGICMDDCWASLVQLNLSQPTWQASVSFRFLNGFTSTNNVPHLEASGSATKITSLVHQVRLWTIGRLQKKVKCNAWLIDISLSLQKDSEKGFTPNYLFIISCTESFAKY